MLIEDCGLRVSQTDGRGETAGLFSRLCDELLFPPPGKLMFGIKGQELVREIFQDTSEFLPPYNQTLVDAVIDEMRTLFDLIREQV